LRVTRMAVVAVTLLMVSAITYAEIPQGYYTDLNGKTQSALKTAACKIINPHTKVSSYQDLPQYFQLTDVYPVGDPRYGQWWDMYGNIPLRLPSFSGLNREHAFPKSWWGGSETIPAYTDLNHLYPSEAKANQAKSNYPLGMVENASKFDNGVSKVGTAVAGQGGGAAFVFEPDDAYKGDFARTYFYMVTCYQDLSWKYKYMLMDGTYPTLNQWSVDLLLKWHREDPVSQKEMDRNEAVYRIQNNRNPFIDFPDLAEYIWGSKMGEPFQVEIPDVPPTEAILITPVQDMYLDFGQVAIGSSVTRSLPVRGQNTSGQINISVVRNFRDVFSVERAGFTHISPSLLNSTNATE
ncbi:MAG: endonuclease, partial [Muribaculaceae bacterium]|nr:endonuclease [Muribaculaceae bacterium]